MINVPKAKPLAKKKELKLKDLNGTTLICANKGFSLFTDKLNEKIIKENLNIKIEEINIDGSFSLKESNLYAKDKLILISNYWFGSNDNYKQIPFNCGKKIPYGLNYKKDSSDLIKEFIKDFKICKKEKVKHLKSKTFIHLTF